MIICKKCGSECKEGTSFCSYCGTEIEKEPAKAIKKTVLKPKTLFAFVLVVVLVIVAFLIASFFEEDSMFLKKKHQWNFFSNEDNDLVIACDGKLVCDFNCEYEDYSISKDSKSIFVLMEDGDLYSVTTKGKMKIDDDVHNFYICSLNDDLIYIKDYESDSETGELYIWNGSNSKLVDDDVESIIAVTPDTNKIYYMKDFQILSTDFEAYISKYGKEGKLMEDQDRIILAASNNGKVRIEYAPARFEDNTYLVVGKEEFEIGYSGYLGEIIVNTSMTEILYEYNDSLYISVDGKEPERIYEDIEGFKLCVPENKVLNSYGTNKVLFVDVDTFLNKTMLAHKSSSRSDIISIDKALDVTVYEEYTSDVVLTEDGKTLFYIDEDDNLCQMKNDKQNSDKEICDNVESYVVSPNGKYLSYATEDGELYFWNNGKDTEVDDDINFYDMTDNGNLYYNCVGDDEITFRSKSGKEEEIDDNERITNLIICGDNAYVIDEDNVLYWLTGEKMTEIEEDIYT